MNCEDLSQGDLLEKYIGGKLDPAIQDEIEIHILDCGGCLHAAELLQAVHYDLTERASEIRSVRTDRQLWPRWQLAGLVSVLSALCILGAILLRVRLGGGNFQPTASSEPSDRGKSSQIGEPRIPTTAQTYAARGESSALSSPLSTAARGATTSSKVAGGRQVRSLDDEAEVLRSLAIQEKALGPDSLDVAQSLEKLSKIYQVQGRYSEALPLFKRSLSIREKALGPDDPEVALSMRNLAELYAQQGKRAEARPFLSSGLVSEEEKAKGFKNGSLSKRVLAQLSGFDLLGGDVLTRGSIAPSALAPKLGKAYGLTPFFAWTTDAYEKTFLFVLRDSTQHEMFRSQVEGTIFEYPSSAPNLKAGETYYWTVQSLSSTMLGAEPSAPVGFLVLPQGDRQEVAESLRQASTEDPYASELAQARIFTEYRLWYDAVATYSDLIMRYPNRADAYEERGDLYTQFVVTKPQAREDFDHADRLRKQLHTGK